MDADCLSIVLNTEVIAVNQVCGGVARKSFVRALTRTAPGTVQDARISRGALVFSWPGRYVPANASWQARAAANTAARTFKAGDAPTPSPAYAVVLAPCNATAPEQLFAFNASTGFIMATSVAAGGCLTFGGLRESNVFLADCEGWVQPDLGGQLWAPNTSGAAGDTTLSVVGNTPYALGVDKSGAAPACGPDPPGTVQVL